MNLHARDGAQSFTFAEQKTTSLFRLVQTNQIAKKSDLPVKRNHFNFLLISYKNFTQICLVKRETLIKKVKSSSVYYVLCSSCATRIYA